MLPPILHFPFVTAPDATRGETRDADDPAFDLLLRLVLSDSDAGRYDVETGRQPAAPLSTAPGFALTASQASGDGDDQASVQTMPGGPSRTNSVETSDALITSKAGDTDGDVAPKAIDVAQSLPWPALAGAQPVQTMDHRSSAALEEANVDAASPAAEVRTDSSGGALNAVSVTTTGQPDMSMTGVASASSVGGDADVEAIGFTAFGVNQRSGGGGGILRPDTSDVGPSRGIPTPTVPLSGGLTPAGTTTTPSHLGRATAGATVNLDVPTVQSPVAVQTTPTVAEPLTLNRIQPLAADITPSGMPGVVHVAKADAAFSLLENGERAEAQKGVRVTTPSLAPFARGSVSGHQPETTGADRGDTMDSTPRDTAIDHQSDTKSPQRVDGIPGPSRVAESLGYAAYAQSAANEHNVDLTTTLLASGSVNFEATPVEGARTHPTPQSSLREGGESTTRWSSQVTESVRASGSGEFAQAVARMPVDPARVERPPQLALFRDGQVVGGPTAVDQRSPSGVGGNETPDESLARWSSEQSSAAHRGYTSAAVPVEPVGSRSDVLRPARVTPVSEEPSNQKGEHLSESRIAESSRESSGDSRRHDVTLEGNRRLSRSLDVPHQHPPVRGHDADSRTQLLRETSRARGGRMRTDDAEGAGVSAARPAAPHGDVTSQMSTAVEGEMPVPASHHPNRSGGPTVERDLASRLAEPATRDLSPTPKGGGDTATMRIEDASGNAAHIRVTVRGEQVHTRIVHENRDVAHHLSARSEELHDALANQGFRDSGVSIRTPRPGSEGGVVHTSLRGAGVGESVEGTDVRDERQYEQRHDRRDEQRQERRDDYRDPRSRRHGRSREDASQSGHRNEGER